MPRNEPSAVPRITGAQARLKSSRVGHRFFTSLVKISRLSFNSRLATISAVPNMPIATMTKPMPSESSGMLKVKRSTPELTSVPTMPSSRPNATIAIALMSEPCASTVAATRPNTISEKYSDQRPEQASDQGIEQVDRRDRDPESHHQVVEDFHRVGSLPDRAVGDEIRAQRERKRQPPHEHQPREQHQDHVQDEHLFPLELVTAEGTDHYQRQRRDEQPERLPEVAVEHAADRDQDQRPEGEGRNRRPFDDEGFEQDRQAKDRKQATEQDREIRRPHAHRGAHLVVNGGPDDKEQAEAKKHQARPEVFRTLDFHCPLSSLLRRQSVTCAPPQSSCARCQLLASFCSDCCPCSWPSAASAPGSSLCPRARWCSPSATASLSAPARTRTRATQPAWRC